MVGLTRAVENHIIDIAIEKTRTLNEANPANSFNLWFFSNQKYHSLAKGIIPASVEVDEILKATKAKTIEDVIRNVRANAQQHRELLNFLIPEFVKRIKATPREKRELAKFAINAHGETPPFNHLDFYKTGSIPAMHTARFVHYVGRERARRLVEELKEVLESFKAPVEFRRIDTTDPETGTGQEMHLLYRATPVLIMVLQKALAKLK